MKTKVQATSVISFYSILSELNKRQLEVLKAMKKLGTANNLQVAKYLNLPINSITPRMNELRKAGIVVYPIHQLVHSPGVQQDFLELNHIKVSYCAYDMQIFNRT